MNPPLSSEIPLLRGPVPLSHLLLKQFVHSGDSAIDATCGNGNDTLLLAELVGTTGKIWAFDIQEKAIHQTADKLSEAGLTERVILIQTGHETMANHVDDIVNAIVFNLGYLPGSDRTVITLPETTGVALEQSLNLLAPGGIVAISIYPGHGGGANERRVVDAWASRLEPGIFHAWRMGQINVSADAPYFVLVQKAT